MISFKKIDCSFTILSMNLTDSLKVEGFARKYFWKHDLKTDQLQSI